MPTTADAPLGRVALLSLEPWDEVMRRNQHFALHLVGSGAVERLTFVEPVPGGLEPRARRRAVHEAVDVLTPPQFLPRRVGGARVTGAWLRRALRHHDLLWINDPVVGAAALDDAVPAVYDVTDDWRSMPQGARDRARTVAAENRLAAGARTVVCSEELQERWRARYAITAEVVRNGVDVEAIETAKPWPVAAPGPVALYVGTLHENRVDVGLVGRLADVWPGTVHLVGPDHLDGAARASLDALGVLRHGPVASADVPRWLAAADVLVCPHVVDDFTLSLDAIKSHEYLATDKPVVATPSSGFQHIEAPGLSVVPTDAFVDAAVRAASTGPFLRTVAVDWSSRAREFAAELVSARTRR